LIQGTGGVSINGLLIAKASGAEGKSVLAFIFKFVLLLFSNRLEY